MHEMPRARMTIFPRQNRSPIIPSPRRTSFYRHIFDHDLPNSLQRRLRVPLLITGAYTYDNISARSVNTPRGTLAPTRGA